jgi:uncharacterized protein YyaL (SSP411 family)
LIELYQAAFQPEMLKSAIELTAKMRSLFEDPAGGYFFTPPDANDLPVRMKETYDGALPAGNSVAMSNLLRLSHITGNTELSEAAWGITRNLAGTVRRLPSGHACLLSALGQALDSSTEIVIVGEADDPITQTMLRSLAARWAPNSVVLLKTAETADELAVCAPFTSDYPVIEGRSTAYVCQNHVCHRPVTDSDEMMRLVEAAESESFHQAS